MENIPEISPEVSLYDQAREAADVISRASPLQPRVAIVLGSGLGALADAVAVSATLPFTAIPHLLPTTVPGHEGQVVLGRFGGVPVAVLRGRLHLYEGYTPQQVTFPLRVLKLLGAEICILTNAAGGLDPALAPGSLMLIRDHIGLPTLTGLNPLFGRNDERFGPRFPAMTDAYDLALRQIARAVASQRGITLAEGVYAMVSGPTFETPAELRMLRMLGADAVGMSTVPEVIVARHMAMRVLGLSTIANQALTDGRTDEMPDHEHVLRTAAQATEHLVALLGDMLAQLA
ncbi:MAG TPA: purine-nucleoside phosphorylase [Ktedonobacterales bacterium]